MPKKSSAIEEIISRYRDALSQKINVNGVFVFGSAARGKMTKDSDIDLIILSSDFAKMKFLQRLQLLSRVSSNCAKYAALDVIGYTPAEFAAMDKVQSPMVEKIKNEGYFVKY